jgi:hypothetical protein
MSGECLRKIGNGLGDDGLHRERRGSSQRESGATDWHLQSAVSAVDVDGGQGDGAGDR